ncbi:MAG: hypothetical protein H7A51_14590 [Akkermansiaceae bacterium]|nr:hypothetical protein [Akkermansiaceae bacterium]
MNHIISILFPLNFLLLSALVTQAATTVTTTRYGQVTIVNESIPINSQPNQLSGSVSYQANQHTTGVHSRSLVSTGPLGGFVFNSKATNEHGYFEFSTATIPSTITTATFQLYLPNNGLTDSATTASTQLIHLRQTSYNPDSAQVSYPDSYPPSYDDLPIVAEATVLSSDLGTTIDFVFNTTGLDYLRNTVTAGGSTLRFITHIGAHDYPTTIEPEGATIKGAVFANTYNLTAAQAPRLTLNLVPEPSSTTLLTLAFLTLFSHRRN